MSQNKICIKYLKDLKITYQCQRRTFLWVSFPILLPVRMLYAFQNWIQVTSAIFKTRPFVFPLVFQHTGACQHDGFFFSFQIPFNQYSNAVCISKLDLRLFEQSPICVETFLRQILLDFAQKVSNSYLSAYLTLHCPTGQNKWLAGKSCEGSMIILELLLFSSQDFPSDPLFYQSSVLPMASCAVIGENIWKRNKI